jgi:hypothetical protein
VNFTTAFREACTAKVGHSHTLAMPERDPNLEDFVKMFPSNEDAAKAAGFGAKGAHKPNTPGWTRRRSFMRNLQRYRTGATEKRTPGPKMNKRMGSIVRAQWRKTARPGTVRQVLELLNKYGAAVTELECTFHYENRAREFDRFAVGITPATLQRSGLTVPVIRSQPIPWAQLADAFLLSWGRAYGMGDYAAGGATKVGAFTFRVGFTGRAQYAYGPSSRPAGAPNATGNKYRGMAS